MHQGNFFCYINENYNLEQGFPSHDAIEIVVVIQWQLGEWGEQGAKNVK